MGKDGDDKGFDEHTRIGGAPPKLPGAPAPAAPAPPPAPAPPAAPPPSLDEHTRIGGAPPKLPGAPAALPVPITPPAAPSLDESTRYAVTPPPIPKAPASAPPPPAAAPPPAVAGAPATRPVTAPPPLPPTGGGDFNEHTILLADLQREFVPPARLQRMQPPGRSDIINLDRTHYLMGRLPSCDLRLYSQTASREHAQLTVRDGHWYLTPVEGKAVLVNGTQVKEEVPLMHKMRLQLGGDELVFLDESGATSIEEA
ncbi:MAG: FHA domain-containing protein, partial [Candidatus Binatia bacterium]